MGDAQSPGFNYTKKMGRSAGFTLIELLIVLAILGILLALGMGFLRSDRIAVDQTARVLAAQVSYTRLQAIKANTFAGLNITTAGNGGYVLWVDANSNRQYDAGADTVVDSYTFGTGNLARVRLVSNSTTLSSFVFDSRGIPQDQSAGKAVLQNLDGSYTKTVCVSTQGRSQVVVGSTCP